MCNLNMINKIVTEARMIQVNLASFQNDPQAFGHLGYMLQQEVERALKIYLEFTGVTVPKTHKLNLLLDMSDNNGSRVVYTPWLRQNAGLLTDWESTGRYEGDVCIELRKLKECVQGVFSFLYQNGFTSKLNPEITDAVKVQLNTACNKDVSGESNAVLNVLYNIYIKPAPVPKAPQPKTLDAYFEKMCITDKEMEIQRLKELYETEDLSVILDRVYDDLM